MHKNNVCLPCMRDVLAQFPGLVNAGSPATLSPLMVTFGMIPARWFRPGLTSLVAEIAARGTPRGNRDTNREGAAEKNATPARFRRENN